jgi:mannosyl-3-phosphoglycerate phosphatase
MTRPFTTFGAGQAILIFTDLDGTLLNSDDYRYDAALPMIAELRSRHIPLIPVTSKTYTEVAALMGELRSRDPFIVENGSAIFWDPADTRFDLSGCQPWQESGWVCEVLGCTAETAREALQQLGTQLGQSLRGFRELGLAGVQELTGLSAADAAGAIARDFSEPFVTPHRLDRAELQAAAARCGLRVTVGDRFSHAIGQGAGKGAAVQRLIDRFRLPAIAPTSGDRPQPRPLTLGLGNSPNDLEMLQAVDRAIVIPSAAGPHPELADRGWILAPEPGCRGWAIALTTALPPANQPIDHSDHQQGS